MLQSIQSETCRNRKGDLENLEIKGRGCRRLAEVGRVLGDAECGSEVCAKESGSHGQAGRRPCQGLVEAWQVCQRELCSLPRCALRTSVSARSHD